MKIRFSHPLIRFPDESHWEIVPRIGEHVQIGSSWYVVMGVYWSFLGESVSVEVEERDYRKQMLLAMSKEQLVEKLL